MKSILSILFLSIWVLAYSQKVPVQHNIVYGNAKDWRGTAEELKLDLYTPKNSGKLPLVIMMHGGGFHQGEKEDLSAFSESLALMGYAVANLEYRQGFDRSPGAFEEGLALAIYRAQQDAATALRFLVANAIKFNIDTSIIILAGESSGGVTALGQAFVSQDEWDKALPLLREKLGEVNSPGSTLVQSYHIKGVVSLWGGIPDTSLITVPELQSIPVLLMHSTDDEEIAFELETHPYVEYTSFHGSYDIAQKFKKNGGCYNLHFIINAPHRFGFSQQYVLKGMEEFLNSIRKQQCVSSEKENTTDNPFISFYDAELD